MHETLDFPDLLRLIDERAAAFRAAVAAAPSLDVQVPTCPEWTLLDLVRHIGEGRRFWAAVVAQGPADAPAARPEAVVPAERADILAWLAQSTQALLDALREAGPDRGCWTWWGASQSPRTCGAVARHQLQQMAVHTYDAELTVGRAQPLADAIALDGIDEFLATCCATTDAWPHEPAVVDYHAAEGRSWRVRLSETGARIAPHTAPGEPDASAEGPAADLVLALHGRIPMTALTLKGDPTLFTRLSTWDPDA